MIQDALNEIEGYLHELHEVCAILEAAEDRINTVEALLGEAYHLYEELPKELEDIDALIQSERKEIEALHSELEGYVMPDLSGFDDTKTKMHDLIRRLSDNHLYIKDAIRRFHLSRSETD